MPFTSLLGLESSTQTRSSRDALYLKVRELIVQGKLPSGTKLPSTRRLATELGMSRSTVVDVFDQLKMEGYLEASQGAATRVSSVASEHFKHARHASLDEPPHPSTEHLNLDRWHNSDPPTAISLTAFRPGLPDISLFPKEEWNACLTRAIKRRVNYDLSYCGYTGHTPLKAQIIEHVSHARYVTAEPEQVIIVPSSQAAFDVIAKLALVHGDCVWAEDPGYPGFINLVQAYDGAIERAPVDQFGANFDNLPGQPKLIYVSPSHQYPTGAMLSLERRLNLLELSREHGALIVEDDYDSDFQFDGAPIASLQGLDKGRNVIYVGTFSKTLAPGLRTAYLIAPKHLTQAAESIAALSGHSVPVHVQVALADFLELGLFRKHIKKMTAEYSQRMDLLYSLLQPALKEVFHLIPPKGGLQYALISKSPIDDKALSRYLFGHGFHTAPISDLTKQSSTTGLLLGIGLVTGQEINRMAPQMCMAILGWLETVRKP
ncbi:PLP-dependent aminotransferase family protein [Aquipseudomonas alcaligenes]|uniref:MocR-like pyridoxine biosynthesis transcription factor PdxR n=1 Tax=Aquipseudomonas alcaligenes TaxID=43263 RepID=UPI0021AC138B|nr:PLP-dependent aminotransferase family protein [Pseudomonas alcaligenes]